MKRIVCLILALVMVFSLAACGSKPADTPADKPAANAPADTPADKPADAPAAEPAGDGSWDINNIGEHKFILAHGQAETSQNGIIYHMFAEKVNELSQGKMVIEEKIGGTLVSDTETLDAIMDGTIDFCHSMGSYTDGTIKDISPLTIAGYYGGDDWLGFAEDTHDLIESIYADYGIKFMGALYQGDSVIVCNDKQIKNPGDVAGLTFRASGTWVSKTVQAWGGAATTIGLADLADAFSKKTVSGVATGYNIIVPFKIYEVAKYITNTTISEGFAALLMNGDTWASLNADEQALLEEAAQIWVKEAHDKACELTVGYKQAIADAGVNEIYDLTAEEQIEFVKLAQSLFAEMEAQDGLLGEKGMQLINLLKEINGLA